MKKLIVVLTILAVTVAGCKKDKQNVLATVSTNAATNITSTTTKTGGNISNTGGTSLTSAGVVYALHANPTVADSIKSNGGGSGAFSISLTGLNANTAYYVRAFAINGTGTAYGNQITFTTAAGLATITTTQVGTISTTAATAPSGGTIVNTGGATITASGVCWSTKPHPTVANSVTTDQVTNNTFTSTLTLLVANTTYYCRAYATNSYGTAYGNELSFNAGSTATVQDIDGNVYHTVTIGTQTWMSENLRVTHYQNGDPITNGLSGFAWATSTTGAYTFPNGDTTNNKTYGKLYNVYAVADSRNIAPAGWHVATDKDWQTLEFSEGMTPADTGSTNQGERGTIGAKFLVGGASGLNIVNAGLMSTSSGSYFYFGTQGWYWTATLALAAYNSYYDRVFNSVSGDPGPIKRTYESYAKPVRCVKIDAIIMGYSLFCSKKCYRTF